MTSREVRDPVHGLIDLSPLEWQVVDSAPFQRLRGVQQLAYTHLVYPGARHSRFEHCLGAAHIAGETADSVNRQADEKVIDRGRVRLAALLHDIGHGPFSHVSEMVFEKRTGRTHVHEAISAAIVRHHPALQEIVEEEQGEWVSDLLAGTGHGAKRSAEKDLIAGPADIDKLDYLLRDSHFCGVNYGRYDLDKVIESARYKHDVAGSKLAYHLDGIYALEEMLLARYHMHRQVYGHRTRVATDLMLIRSMELGLEEGLLPTDMFEPPGEIGAEYVDEYVQWDDHSVVHALLGGPDGSAAASMMRALIERRLLKRVDHVTYAELEETFGRELAGYIIEADEETLDDSLPEIEASIAHAVETDPYWVVVHYDRRDSPILRPFTAKIEGKDVVLVDDQGQIGLLHDESEVFGRGEVEPHRAIALYLRPPGDDLDLLDPQMTHDRLMAGLEELGHAAIQV